MNNTNSTTIDARPILAAGGCPFDSVFEAAAKLEQGDNITVIAPFNPVPIHMALAGVGIDHVKTTEADNSFTVKFVFTPLKARTLQGDLDLTDLEPPQPMAKVIETMAEATAGQTFGFHTRFKPVHMLGNLDPQENLTESVELEDGTWHTRVLKREIVKCEH